jgi:hypothetical protein
MIEGAEGDLRRATSVLEELGIQEWEIYHAPDLSNE